MSLSLNHACKVGCKFAVATAKTSLSETIHLKRERNIYVNRSVKIVTLIHVPYTGIDALISHIFIS